MFLCDLPRELVKPYLDLANTLIHADGVVEERESSILQLYAIEWILLMYYLCLQASRKESKKKSTLNCSHCPMRILPAQMRREHFLVKYGKRLEYRRKTRR